ncbi:hypothetical protein [Nocardioides sp. B-3]|uniref:hypothetical protein n=1 Tax=Nocardioides sp. B-3 TaxID=2895565 RepID=UPI003FA529E1
MREQHLGSLEGRAYEETRAEAEQHDWSDPELPMAGGESVGAVRRRPRPSSCPRSTPTWPPSRSATATRSAPPSPTSRDTR